MAEYPKDKEVGYYGHTAVKAGLNAIPVAGGMLAAVFETVFSAPIEKRKEEWLIRLSVTVDELCSRIEDLTPEKLSKNELFISAYLQASNIAIRTHQKEKVDALANAVKNSVLQESIGETKTLIFIRLIDDMTPMHFRILHFLTFAESYIKTLDSRQPPNQWKNWGSLSNVWDELFPEIKSSNDLLELIVSDLHKFGLINCSHFFEARMTNNGTQLGKQFIEFIEVKPVF